MAMAATAAIAVAHARRAARLAAAGSRGDDLALHRDGLLGAGDDDLAIGDLAIGLRHRLADDLAGDGLGDGSRHDHALAVGIAAGVAVVPVEQAAAEQTAAMAAARVATGVAARIAARGLAARLALAAAVLRPAAATTPAEQLGIGRREGGQADDRRRQQDERTLHAWAPRSVTGKLLPRKIWT